MIPVTAGSNPAALAKPIARLAGRLLLITANRTVRNRYERPFPSDLVHQFRRVLVEQENAGGGTV
jgi:hypothetical protein